MKEMLAPYLIISKEITKAFESGDPFCLKPEYEKEFKQKLVDLKLLIDEYLWSEDLFFYTILHPKETGVDGAILAPDLTFSESVPFILIPKKGFTFETTKTRDDFDLIYINSIDEVKRNKKCSKKLKKFIELNQMALTRHWAQITDTGGLCRELVVI